MFFHPLNIPVEPTPPSDAEDTETLLTSSRPDAHAKNRQRKRFKRDLRIGLKSCVVTSCVWLLVLVVVLNGWGKRLLLEATDRACIGHIFKYCKKLRWIASGIGQH